MREINNISDADLKAMESLDKNCLDLHLFPPPKTFIQMEVEGPDGTKVESRKMRSQSWHRNAYNLILRHLLALSPNAFGASYGPGSVGHRSVNSVVYTGSELMFTTVGKATGPVGDSSYGLVVGNSDRPENFEDFSLGFKFPNGTKEVPSMIYVPRLSSLPSEQQFYSFSVNGGGNRIAVGRNLVSDNLRLYNIVNAEHSVIVDIPATGISFNQTVRGVEWSPDGQYLALMGVSPEVVKIYKYTAGSGFAQVFSQSVGSGPYALRWSPNGNWLCVSGNRLDLIKNNGDDTFTAFAPSIILSSGRFEWSPTSSHIVLVNGTAPYLRFLKINNDGTITNITPTNNFAYPGGDVAISPDGKYCIVYFTASPYAVYFKKTGEDEYVQIASPSISYGGSYPSWLQFSSDSKYFVFLTGYCTITRVRNNNDDTFTVDGAGGDVYGGSTAAYRMTRIPQTDTYIIIPQYSVYAGTFMLWKFLPGLSYSAQSQATSSYDATTKKQSVVLQRFINNNTSIEAKVLELGLYLADGSTPYMLSRDVLAEPLIVPPAYKLTVTYTMEMTFPA